MSSSGGGHFDSSRRRAVGRGTTRPARLFLLVGSSRVSQYWPSFAWKRDLRGPTLLTQPFTYPANSTRPSSFTNWAVTFAYRRSSPPGIAASANNHARKVTRSVRATHLPKASRWPSVARNTAFSPAARTPSDGSVAATSPRRCVPHRCHCAGAARGRAREPSCGHRAGSLTR